MNQQPTVDEVLDAHIKALDLAITLLTEKISKPRKEEAIGIMRECLRASRDLQLSRSHVIRVQ